MLFDIEVTVIISRLVVLVYGTLLVSVLNVLACSLEYRTMEIGLYRISLTRYYRRRYRRCYWWYSVVSYDGDRYNTVLSCSLEYRTTCSACNTVWWRLLRYCYSYLRWRRRRLLQLLYDGDWYNVRSWSCGEFGFRRRAATVVVVTTMTTIGDAWPYRRPETLDYIVDQRSCCIYRSADSYRR